MPRRSNRFGNCGVPTQQPFMNMPNYYQTPVQPTQTTPNSTCQTAQPIAQQPVMPKTCGCKSTYQECPPIVTCSKNIVEEYHVVKQPYVHNYHTEIVHHHIKQAEYIPTYSCSEVHVNDTPNM